MSAEIPEGELPAPKYAIGQKLWFTKITSSSDYAKSLCVLLGSFVVTRIKWEDDRWQYSKKPSLWRSEGNLYADKSEAKVKVVCAINRFVFELEKM